MRNFMNSIFNGFGRTLGRFLFYLLLGILAYLIFDNWEVKALTNTRDIVEINVNYKVNNSNVSQRFTTNNTFLYDNQYYSDLLTTGNLYLLGYWETNVGTLIFETQNINFYFPSSCSSSEMLNYNINIYFYCQSSYCPTQPMNITSGNNTCTGNWLLSDNNPIYQLTCNSPAGSLPLGSLYFTSKYIGKLNYRVAIQKNFNYTCDVNSQAIIENQNVNTDRTIQAITDLNGNVTIINNSITEVNNTITDDSPPSNNDVTGFLDELRDIIPTNGTISNLLLIPIDLVTKLINAFNNTCSPLNFLWFNINGQTSFTFQCVNLNTLIKNSTLVNLIDMGLLIGLVYTFSGTLIRMWNTIIHLEDEFESEYIPQHAKARTRMDRWE